MPFTSFARHGRRSGGTASHPDRRPRSHPLGAPISTTSRLFRTVPPWPRR